MKLYVFKDPDRLKLREYLAIATNEDEARRHIVAAFGKRDPAGEEWLRGTLANVMPMETSRDCTAVSIAVYDGTMQSVAVEHREIIHTPSRIANTKELVHALQGLDDAAQSRPG